MMRADISPEEFVSQIEQTWVRHSDEERKRLVDHAKAWSIVTYEGEVPLELHSHIQRLEEACL